VPDEGHGFADPRMQRFMTNVVNDLAQEPRAFAPDCSPQVDREVSAARASCTSASR
jgi:hypothetical protein